MVYKQSFRNQFSNFQWKPTNWFFLSTHKSFYQVQTWKNTDQKTVFTLCDRYGKGVMVQWLQRNNFYVSSFDNEAENNVTRSAFFGSYVGSFLQLVHSKKMLVITNYTNPNIQFLINWSLTRSLNIFKKGNGKTKFLFL